MHFDEAHLGFCRCIVEAGSKTAFHFSTPIATLAERDVATHSMVVVPGDYGVRVARHASDPGAAFLLSLTN